MQYRFDIRGNLLKVTDALGRTAFTHVYDLKPKSGEGKDEKGANILRTTHIDSGTKTAVFDAAYRPTELRDAKGALILHGYDELNRPTRIWARDNDSEDVTLRQKLIYGDDITDGPSTPTNTNHLGKLYQHYDEAGKVTMDGYDFKGNLLEKTRKVISDTELLSVFGGGTIDCYRVDWGTSTDSILGSEDFKTDTSFDALNRPKQITYPENVNSDRKVATPTYNRAGALESVDFDGTNFVEHIAYNAKGQRLLIALGNGVMTRYTYDSETFRLIRQRSETYTQTGWTFSSNGSVKQDTGYQYDLSGNIIKTTERTTNCGVGGTNELDRHYQYDALYRLLQATGRENAPTITPIWDDRYRSTDHSITTAYTQNYSYDRMGNILKLKHTGNSSFTRIFNPTGGGTAPTEYGADNLLNEVKIGGTTYSFTYDANGNLIQENASRFMEWDHADKMRCFYIDDGGTITKYAHYLYDAGGNRVKKLVRNDGGSYTSTTYIDGIFEHLTDGTDTQSLLHVMDDKSRIAMLRVGDDLGDTTPALKYVLEDHLGDSVVELGSDGTFVAKEEYYPFGETSFASYGKKRYKYNGKERDEESGMYNYGMRYYSAWTCRFISVDPLASKYPFYASYQYAGNKPIIAIDVDGLEDENISNPDGTSNGQSEKITGVVHFIDKDSGKTLGSHDFGGGGESIRSISVSDYNNLSNGENNFADLAPIGSISGISVSQNSRAVIINYAQINKDLSSMTQERKKSSGEIVENNMVLIYNSDSNTITSEDITDVTKNDNHTAKFDSLETKSGSSYIKGSPEKHVIGEIHTHPFIHKKLSPFGGETTFGDKNEENGPGLSANDLNRLNQKGHAPAYALGIYEDSKNPIIWTVDKHASSHKDSYNPDKARLQDAINGNFNIVLHSISRNLFGR